MRRTITARYLLTSTGTLDFPLLTVEDGAIIALRALTAAEHEQMPVTNRFRDAVLAPAYVDVHLHGCAGYDVMTADAAGMTAIGRFLAHHGVGAFLPTTVTSTENNTLRALSGLAGHIAHVAPDNRAGAVPIGIHLEGPFLSHHKRGVHSDGLLQAPSIQAFDRLWQAAEGCIVLMTIAPELPGALEVIAHASALGVRCSLGHTDASYAEAVRGHAAGAISATHTFNAMRRLDHRDPGVVGFVLDQDAMYAEVIADGLHVDPVMVRLLSKAKPPDRMLLVTDGISATGMPDGIYKLGEMEVEVIEGRCTSGGAIAGSTLTLDRGVRNYMQFTGAPLRAAVSAASKNPARLVGQEGAWGTLAVGRQANLTVLSSEGEVIETFLRGMPTIGEGSAV